mmetsp:Transcript_99125/g.314684  ORF Transcript_99125/g.314684 Transcript_99125/m.314684 type:complete len:794 (+) Transcript_99125:465-2846(+)
MVQCFPTLALLVACCPHPEVRPPEEPGCPPRYRQYRRECCAPEIASAIFRQLGTVSTREVARLMPEDKYAEVIRMLNIVIPQYVRDTNVHSVEAWFVLALAAARDAIMDVDRVKDAFVRQTTTFGMQTLLHEARQVSRKISRAMFRIENFHQFLIVVEATHRGLIIQGFDPNLVREQLSPALEAYRELAVAHDLFAYSLLPAMAQISEGGTGTGMATSAPAPGSPPTVVLLVVSLGAWAKTGFITVWSVLRRRSAPLRVFVLGDLPGLGRWREAAEEFAAGGADGADPLRGVRFDYVDFATHPRFRAYLRRYPRGCAFGAAGQAILARVVCHELLPPDVDRVIALDLGDVLVLDDIRELWDVGDRLREHHLMAAAHAVSLHHVNGGVVLYDVRRMRDRNFTLDTLRAARHGARRDPDGACPRDQSIINLLHGHRAELGLPGPSPVMLLPCRWSVFPAPEWQPHWNSPEMWLPEVRDRKRFPGILSTDRVEVFCPDEVDLLSAWAFLPISEERQSRQARIRAFAHHEGRRPGRYCTERGVGDRCCACGEPAALLHVAGDMKEWPAMQSFLRSYLPGWREPPPEDALVRSASRSWWGGRARAQRMLSGTEREAYVVARGLGLNTAFGRCATLATEPGGGAGGAGTLAFHSVELGPLALPAALEVETTAPRDAHLLLGVGGHSGLELVMGSDGGRGAALRWVRSAPGWAARGDLMSVPSAAQRAASEGGGEGAAEAWSKFAVSLGPDGRFEVVHGGASWGSYVPEFILAILRQSPLTVSVGTPGLGAKWGVCLAGD